MSNDFYIPSGYPAPNAPGASASMRAELDLIEAGFEKLPLLTGNGNKLAVINAGGTAIVAEAKPTGDLVGTTATQTLTNKTVNLANNTLAGTTAQFNAALSDGDFATLAGTETLSNKSLGLSTNTLSGTTAQFNAALSDGDFATLAGTETLTNKTISGGSVSGAAVTGLSSPTNPGDAASKAYVDSVAEGLDAKASCRVATTANITLSGTQTIDGVAVIAGDRVLVKNQSTTSQNGIYVVAAGSWARSSDANSWAELVSAFTFVEQGTTQTGNGYIATVAAGGTIDSTAVTWSQFSSAGQLLPGNGLTRTGNTLDVVTANSGRIVVNADNIDLATAGTAGTYKSVTTDAYGRVTAGTNPTTLAGYGITDAYTKTYIDTLYGDTASAAASAAAAAASYDAFDDRWLGAKTSNPTVDNDGNALQTGAVYFSTPLQEMRVYNGSSWQTATTLPSGAFKNSFTATAGQTTHAWTGGGSYNANFLYVYVNGALLSSVDYTATDGTNISFATALTAGDEVQMLTFKSAGTVEFSDIVVPQLAVAATDINVGSASYFTKTITGNTTFTVSNVPPSGRAATFILELTNAGTSVTWWNGIRWEVGVAPLLTSSGTDVLGFYTINGGSTWRGFLLARDSK